MMGRHVDRAKWCPGRDLSQSLDVQSITVDGDRYNGGTGAPEGLPGGSIAHLLDGDDVPRTDKRPRSQREGHLAATRDKDILGGYGKAARAREHRRQGLAECRMSFRIAVPEQFDSPLRHDAPIGAAE